MRFLIRGTVKHRNPCAGGGRGFLKVTLQAQNGMILKSTDIVTHRSPRASGWGSLKVTFQEQNRVLFKSTDIATHRNPRVGGGLKWRFAHK